MHRDASSSRCCCSPAASPPGLVLTGRMRDGDRRRGADARRRPQPAVPVRRPAGRRRPRCPTSAASPSAPCRPWSTSRRSRSCAGRTRRSQRSVLPVLLRRRRRLFGVAARRREQPRLGRHRQRRRLHPDQQPRRRRRIGTRSRSRQLRRSPSRWPTSARWRRSIIGVDPATDLALLKVDAQEPADDAVGRFVEAEGRRVGAGDRQSVPAQPDGDARHRLGARPHATSASRPTRTSSRPTRRSIPATPAARWSTRRGELVGINTAIFSQSGGYQGIGFAVPSNLARRVVDDLQQYGEVRRGSIGYVEIAPLTPQIAQRARRHADTQRRAGAAHAPRLGAPIAAACVPATSSSASTARR